MFIARPTFEALQGERIKAQAEADALRSVNVQLNAHMDWMRVRLTQLEFERAALLKRYMNIDIPVPSIEQPDEHPDPNATMDFNDVGDTEAARLGLSWNADGTINYAKA